jgi:LCP family protein required for cell wall assembly
MKKKRSEQFKVAITAVLIACLSIATGVAYIYKQTRQDLMQKDGKISMLISEIGDLKDQNENLYQYLKGENSNLAGAISKVQQLGDNIGNLGVGVARKNSNYEKDLESMQQLKDELSQTKLNLLDIIGNKEKIIEDLTSKNRTIAEKVTGTKHMPGILNTLILGENMGLTDTIILASANSSNKKITFISIPRDLYYNGRKINEYYERYGAVEMEKVIGEITGIFPDKYVVVDMQSFIDVVNMMGGIDLDVEKNLTDIQYPGPDKSYVKVSFKKGLQHMSGQRALEYVRSRKSTTDFDRSGRQQQVLEVMKQKAEDLHLSENISKLVKIYDTIKDRISTDISPLDVLNFYNTYHIYAINSGNIISNEKYLYSTYNTQGQYILLPYKGNYAAIRQYVGSLIES